MNTDRPCGCKSFRSCFVCQETSGIKSIDISEKKFEDFSKIIWVFCPQCIKVFKSTKTLRDCADHSTEIGQSFYGIRIIPEFVTPEEENHLIEGLDLLPWDQSQSGRRKQNFGPRANFKKRKTKVGNFVGFPKCTQFIQERFKHFPDFLDGYRTVEQCSIEYKPETGSCIEPHIDDCWIWGERIVQLNLLSESVLTFFPFDETQEKYNLVDVLTYPQITNQMTGDVKFNPFKQTKNPGDPIDHYVFKDSNKLGGVVRVPLPRRSLLVMTGEPRYQWEHAILRRDINSRRVVIAYRELTPTYLPGGKEESIGKLILEQAERFF